MTTFKDGPAKGQKLNLSRTPIFLRVTHDKTTGKWDALNQLEDTAKPEETILVYRATSNRPMGISCGGSGCRLMMQYAIYWNQPADEILRDNKQWVDWVETQRPYVP